MQIDVRQFMLQNEPQVDIWCVRLLDTVVFGRGRFIESDPPLKDDLVSLIRDGDIISALRCAEVIFAVLRPAKVAEYERTRGQLAHYAKEIEQVTERMNGIIRSEQLTHQIRMRSAGVYADLNETAGRFIPPVDTGQIRRKADEEIAAIRGEWSKALRAALLTMLCSTEIDDHGTSIGVSGNS